MDATHDTHDTMTSGTAPGSSLASCTELPKAPSSSPSGQAFDKDDTKESDTEQGTEPDNGQTDRPETLAEQGVDVVSSAISDMGNTLVNSATTTVETLCDSLKRRAETEAGQPVSVPSTATSQRDKAWRVGVIPP